MRIPWGNNIAVVQSIVCHVERSETSRKVSCIYFIVLRGILHCVQDDMKNSL